MTSPIHTPLCELLGIEHPVIQGAIGPYTSAELTAAISNAGGLGSIGTAAQSPERVRELLDRITELTDRPYAINHTARPFVEEYFQASLEARPALISYAIGEPGDLPKRAHEEGIRFMQQVHTVEQAERAAEREVDVIIAQGAESGGFCGPVASLPLVPQVVDAVDPIPVVAAGGIADGRGLAAALVLGAQGVNIGTRFLAAAEAEVPEEWKRDIVASPSERAVKADFVARALPATEGVYGTTPRVLPSPFIERWLRAGERGEEDLDAIRAELEGAMAEGRGAELLPFTGQTAGLIDEVRPAAEIISELVEGAAAALRRGAELA